MVEDVCKCRETEVLRTFCKWACECALCTLLIAVTGGRHLGPWQLGARPSFQPNPIPSSLSSAEIPPRLVLSLVIFILMVLDLLYCLWNFADMGG
jgi:hypothetical protein